MMKIAAMVPRTSKAMANKKIRKLIPIRKQRRKKASLDLLYQNQFWRKKISKIKVKRVKKSKKRQKCDLIIFLI